MLGIFIIIAAYRYYASLAKNFNKVKWHYGLLAIAVYVGTQFIFAFAYGIYIAFTDPNASYDRSFNSLSLINLIGWLLSIGAVYGIYVVLEKKFQKERLRMPSVEIEEIGRKED